MRKAQAKGGRIKVARQEIFREAIEGSLAPGRALAQRPEERERLDAALHAEGEDLGHRRVDREAREVVRELRDRAGADRADIERLIADRAQHRLVALVGRAITADPDRELATLGAGGSAAHGRIEELHLLLR